MKVLTSQDSTIMNHSSILPCKKKTAESNRLNEELKYDVTYAELKLLWFLRFANSYNLLSLWVTAAQWLERRTGERWVMRSNPTGTASKLGQVHLPHIACVFQMSSLLSGVYAREVKVPTQGVKCRGLLNSEINHYCVSPKN